MLLLADRVGVEKVRVVLGTLGVQFFLEPTGLLFFLDLLKCRRILGLILSRPAFDLFRPGEELPFNHDACTDVTHALCRLLCSIVELFEDLEVFLEQDVGAVRFQRVQILPQVVGEFFAGRAKLLGVYFSFG